MKLNEIKINHVVKILGIESNAPMKRRLFDLGFIPGEEVKCVLESYHNDPRAYKINGSVIALRNKDAREVWVDYE